MVRFIKLLEEELKSVGNADLKKKVGDLLSAHNLPSQQGPVRKISLINVNDQLGDVKPVELAKDRRSKNSYYELLLLARRILDQVKQEERIDFDQISDLIKRLVNEFHAEHCYNPLLRYTYLHTNDNYIIGHMVNGAILAIGFGCYLGMPKRDLVDLGLCAFLHDISMINYFDVIDQNKELTEEELAQIKEHPVKSSEILTDILSKKLTGVVLEVHEREMGQGYPRGKSWNEISVWAKLIAICDVYTALTHARVYRNDYNPFSAIKMLIQIKGEELDERLIKQFIDYLSIYPVNSFVYLNTGEIAQVIRSNFGVPTKPIIQVVVSQNNRLEVENNLIDLKASNLIFIKGVVERDKERDIFTMLKEQEDLK